MTDAVPTEGEVNQTATLVDTALKDAETLGDTAAETAAEAYVPFLNWPIIKQLFEYAVDSISALGVKFLELRGTFLISEFDSRVERNAVQAELAKLTADANAKASAGTISADEAAWLKAVSGLIHSDGSATPQ